MARIGKIARLPESIRTELNLKLLAGEPAVRILPWLNGLLEVQQILETDFEGLHINDENLSKWRNGGYQDWLNRRERVSSIRELSGISVKLAEANGGNISEGAAAIAAGQILTVLERLDDLVKSADEKTDPGTPPSGGSDARDRLETISGIVGDLTLAITRLRKGDSTNAQLKLNQDRLAQNDAALQLARQKFEQQLAEYRDKVAEQKRAIEGALVTAKSGGITPETLARIEEAAALL